MAADVLDALLPASLDSEGLDAAALQDAMLRLDEFQQQARATLFTKLAHSIHSGTPSFEAALAQVAQDPALLVADSPEATLAQHVTHYRQLAVQEQELADQLAASQLDGKAQALAEAFQSHLAAGRVMDAAQSIHALRELLRAPGEAGGPALTTASSHGLPDADLSGLGADLGHVQHQTQRVAAYHEHNCDNLGGHLLSLLDAGVEGTLYVAGAEAQGEAWIRGDLTEAVSAALGPGGLPTRDAWAALVPLGQLVPRMSALAEALLQGVLRPLLRLHVVWEVTPGSGSSGTGGGAHITWHLPPGETPATPDAAALRKPSEACRQVLNALAQTAFGLDEALLRGLGEALWPRLCEGYLELYVTPAAAAVSQAGHAHLLQELAQAAAELEDWAANMGIVEGPCLAPAAASAISQLEARQQVAPLTAARDALLGDLRGDGQPVVVGQPLAVDHPLYQRLLSGQAPKWEAADPGAGLLTVHPLASRGQYRVGQGAATVADLVGQVLQQAAAAGSPATAVALVHALRKVAAIARCLPNGDPTARDRLTTVLPLALLHHNGLLHLADALLLAVPVYGPALEAALGEPLGLLEPALLLRHQAQQVLQQQVAAQQALFQELLANGLAGLRKRGRAAAQALPGQRKAIAQVMHTLGRLGRVLVDYLAVEEATQVAVSVLGTVCSGIVGLIMGKGDIGIDESRELRELLAPLVDEALVVVLPAPPSADGDPDTALLSGVPLAVLRRAALASCAPLRQLLLLLELLDAGIKDLVAAWETRRMQDSGFTADDTVHLLCALFEASEYRKDAISRVRASPW